MDNTTNKEAPVNQIAALLSGEVDKEQNTAPVEETQEAVVDNVDEAPVEIQEDAESLEAPVEANADTEQVDESSTDEDVDTLNNLAEELDVPIADMYALNVNLGEGQDPVTLGVLKDFYESNQNIEEVRTQLQTRETELQDELSRAKDAPAISNDLLQARAEVLAIQNQYGSIDWETLRTQDPGQYAALQTDMRTNFESAKARETQATNQVNTHQETYRRMEQDKLYSAMPELKDDAVRVQTLTDVQKFATSYGFTSSELDKIEDSRLMKLLIDASKTSVAKTTAKAKQVDKTPTASKPVASKATSLSRKESLKRLTQKAKQTGETRDKVNAISAIIS